MSSESPVLVADLTAAVAALAAVSRDVADYRGLDEGTLMEVVRLGSEAQRWSNTHAALAAGEIGRRSRPELGHSGLAQRAGFRTPEEMVKVTTGSTGRDAVTSVRVGRLAQEASGAADPLTGEMDVPSQPWLTVVGHGLTDGSLSVAASDSIRNGLGEPTAEITELMLADAAAQLAKEAALLDPDRLYRRARELRDGIDEEGIADREKARWHARALRFRELPDGMGRLTWDLDPESAAIVSELFDRATSPRRGGPRFVNPDDVATSHRILADDRTTEQLASDTFLHLLSAGADADPSELLGSGGAVVSILVASDAVTSGKGAGRISGQAEPVSMETVQRMLCAGASVPIVFDDQGQALDLGREQRLYNKRQRKALAARDGGCMAVGCDRPPSWTEAHHIVHWARDGGNTNIADGILLCKHHHLVFHNNKWEIVREGATYWLIPPPDVDPEQKPIQLHSKSAALRDLMRKMAS